MSRSSPDHKADAMDSAKATFDIDAAMDAIREGVRSFRKAALFELYDDGFQSSNCWHA